MSNAMRNPFMPYANNKGADQPAYPCSLINAFDVRCLYGIVVVLRYNDHSYNGNFDFRRNFFGNRSFLIKIYYITTEFALSDTDGDFGEELHFCT